MTERKRTTEADPKSEYHRWYPAAEVTVDGVRYLVEQNNLGGSRVSTPDPKGGLKQVEWTAECLVRLFRAGTQGAT